MTHKERRQSGRTVRGFASRRGEKLVEGLTRAELVKKYEHKVKFIAGRLATNLPSSIDVDDLVSVGFIGLMDAADKFKECRGVKFSTFAEFRIRGAIIDELRNLDWMPHCARGNAKKIEQTYRKLEQENGRRPTESEVSARLGVKRERLQKMRGRFTGLSLVSYEEHEHLHDPVSHSAESNPFSTVLRKNVTDFLIRLLKNLGEDERIVLSCYYFRGLNLKEISEILQVSESRASQIHTKAILHLKRLLRENKPVESESMFSLLLDAA